MAVRAEVSQNGVSGDELLVPALFRAINDRISELLDKTIAVQARSSDLRDFICECRSRDCTSTVRATVAEFDAIRAGENLFLVDPNHAEEPDRLVRKTPRFAIVELRPPTAHRPPKSRHAVAAVQ
jgi:hypothetical protein